MTTCMTVNDVRRLLIAANSFELKYNNRIATLYEVAFTLSFFTVLVVNYGLTQ